MSGARPGNGGPHFQDGKSADALRTIGEVAAALNIRPHVLRYWEEQFPMLRPVKRSGARRYYRAEDVALIAMIDRLVHQKGYTLRGARAYLEGGANGATNSDSAAAVAPAPVVSSGDAALLAGLSAIRSRLADALTAA